MGRVYQVDRDHPDAEVVRLAHSVLSGGGVAVLPTETVYGLSLDPFSCASPDELFVMKRRSHELTIPWLVSDASALDELAHDVPYYARRLACAFWPGALTLVVRASHVVPLAYRAQDGTIALRVCDSPFVTALLSGGGALCTTSANTHGAPPPTSIDELEPRIARHSAIVIDGGPTTYRVPSTIVSCIGTEPRFLREAALSRDQVLEVLS
jgi:release factor glutamine methyltransferase